MQRENKLELKTFLATATQHVPGKALPCCRDGSRSGSEWLLKSAANAQGRDHQAGQCVDSPHEVCQNGKYIIAAWPAISIVWNNSCMGKVEEKHCAWEKQTKEDPPASAANARGRGHWAGQCRIRHIWRRSAVACWLLQRSSRTCSSSADHLPSSCCGRTPPHPSSSGTGGIAFQAQSPAARSSLSLPGCSSSAQATFISAFCHCLVVATLHKSS